MTGVAGGEHTLYKTRKGEVFSAGACGLGWCRLDPMCESLFRWRSVQIPEPVKLLYPSYYHNLAVGSNTGKLYTWGCGTFTDGGMDGVIPALGPGKASDRGELPTFIPVAGPIVQITGGAYHSAVLTEAGRVLTFGAGQLGQLGRPTLQSDASGLPVDQTPSPALGVTEPIKSIGSGFYNTFALCKSGKLYCTGENQNRQCGQGDDNLRQLTHVKEVTNAEQVDGGYCHTLIKTISGKVYSMGCGDDGQRGDGKATDNERAILTPISLPVAVQQVAAGANHSVVLGTNGVAYTFGANDVGQCGVPSDPYEDDDDDDDDGLGPVLTPKPVSLPKHSGEVVNVSAGYAHTVLTMSSGKVFVFGQNDNGQLGVGANKVAAGLDPEVEAKPVELAVPEL
eukprot:CAMPEP_0198287000 /NCGR_PEP_ID=MMETSP1449-20131203/5953_1 /TAXON_ID=420275 /ORGANISM="Attheya septentrionalis, Strain CCMP2084" /LENGTH=394 /DNA_ID=CAMNT_0043984883 /DNA_START=94 /DNA_END=1278 /DNA_ORIENTATION=-